MEVSDEEALTREKAVFKAMQNIIKTRIELFRKVNARLETSTRA